VTFQKNTYAGPYAGKKKKKRSGMLEKSCLASPKGRLAAQKDGYGKEEKEHQIQGKGKSKRYNTRSEKERGDRQV